MRKTQKRSLKNSLVIVCEGTETEYQYFEEIADIVRKDQPNRYGRIKVVPTPEECVLQTERRKSQKRKMRSGMSPLLLYWVKEETSEQEYNKNRLYPARFVREAQLFMVEDGFSEAWAVFDKEHHPGHSRAWELSQCFPQVNIAFSSYCFEEWILCHFEKNAFPFLRSICKGKECGLCGTGCKGKCCIVGRLRAKNYISNYVKSMGHLFSDLSKHLDFACINAAWLRNLDDEPLEFKRNPYTNVDELVLYLLNRTDRYEWIKTDKIFQFEGCHVVVLIEKEEIVFEYDGSATLIIPSGNLNYCDKYGNVLEPVCSSNLILMPERDECRVKLSRNAHYIQLKEHIGKSLRKIYLLELPFFI